jgi:hypothetical protein
MLGCKNGGPRSPPRLLGPGPGSGSGSGPAPGSGSASRSPSRSAPGPSPVPSPVQPPPPSRLPILGSAPLRSDILPVLHRLVASLGGRVPCFLPEQRFGIGVYIPEIMCRVSANIWEFLSGPNPITDQWGE